LNESERQISKVAIRSAKTEGRDLRREEGMKSRENFKGDELRILRNSGGVMDG